MTSIETPLKPLTARDRLIVALDCETPDQSRRLVEILGEEVAFYKVGWRLFLQAGMPFVGFLRDAGKSVFLDLKMDDIAETVETAVATIRDDITFLTLQGGMATAQAAIRGRGGREHPKFLQVTLLSSLDEEDLGGHSVEDFVLDRASKSLEAGCDGLIASGDSIRIIRERFGPSPIIVSPGIRPSGGGADDHKRPATPASAIGAGSDYLVVGRPIWKDPAPLDSARRILEEIDGALGRL